MQKFNPKGHRPHRRFAYLSNSVSCLATFVIACFTIHSAAPFPNVPVVNPKLQCFLQHKDDYDVVFIGTSRVYRGLSPVVFDRQLAARGHPLRSFNFGADGMMPWEIDAVLRPIFASKPRRLRWILVEPTLIWTSIAPAYAGTRRASYWHSLSNTASVCGEVLRNLRQLVQSRSPQRPVWVRDQLITLGTHLQLFAMNYSNIGDGVEWLRGPDPQDDSLALGPDRDGYGPLTGQGPMRVTELAEYRKLLAAMKQPDPAGQEFASEMYAGIAALIRRHGATAIFVKTPTPYTLRSWPSASTDEIVMAFDDPEKFPHLFHPEARVDPQHLTPAGAEEFTNLVAEQFAEKLTNRSSLTAHPRPLPDGSDPGRTTITWDTGDESLGEVYLARSGHAEILLAAGTRGSTEVPGTELSGTTEFRFYTGREHQKLLNSVTVTRPVGATITATPNPVPAGDGAGVTNITWDTGDGSWGELYLAPRGKPEVLFTTGATGTQQAPWIVAGGTYEFRLYAGTERKRLLGRVIVTGGKP